MRNHTFPPSVSLQNIKPLALVFHALQFLPFATRKEKAEHQFAEETDTEPRRNGALPPPRLHGGLRRPRGRLLRPLLLPSEAGGLAEAARPHVLRPLRRRRRAPRAPPLPRHLLPLPETPVWQQRHLHVQVNNSTTTNLEYPGGLRSPWHGRRKEGMVSLMAVWLFLLSQR